MAILNRLMVPLLVVGLFGITDTKAAELHGTATGDVTNRRQNCVDTAAPGVCKLSIYAIINGNPNTKLTLTWSARDPKSPIPPSKIPDLPATVVLNNETTIILQYNNPTVQQGMPLPARFSAGKKRFVKITLVTPKSDNNPGRPAKIEILNESEYMLSDGNGSLTVADE
jgi:hypothetical protein